MRYFASSRKLFFAFLQIPQKSPPPTGTSRIHSKTLKPSTALHNNHPLAQEAWFIEVQVQSMGVIRHVQASLLRARGPLLLFKRQTFDSSKVFAKQYAIIFQTHSTSPRRGYCNLAKSTLTPSKRKLPNPEEALGHQWVRRKFPTPGMPLLNWSSQLILKQYSVLASSPWKYREIPADWAYGPSSLASYSQSSHSDPSSGKPTS